MSEPDNEVRAHTVRLEFPEEPGELLRARESIVAHGVTCCLSTTMEGVGRQPRQTHRRRGDGLMPPESRGSTEGRAVWKTGNADVQGPADTLQPDKIIEIRERKGMKTELPEGVDYF